MVYRGFPPWRCGSTEPCPPPASRSRPRRNLRNARPRARCGHVRGDRCRRQSNRPTPELRSCRHTARYAHPCHAQSGPRRARGRGYPPGARDAQSIRARKAELGGRKGCSMVAVNRHSASCYSYPYQPATDFTSPIVTSRLPRLLYATESVFQPCATTIADRDVFSGGPYILLPTRSYQGTIRMDRRPVGLPCRPEDESE